MFSAQPVSGCSHFFGIGISNNQVIGFHQVSDLFGIDANKMNFNSANIIDGNKNSYWATDDDVLTSSFEIDLGEPTQFNRVMI